MLAFFAWEFTRQCRYRPLQVAFNFPCFLLDSASTFALSGSWMVL